MSRKMMKLTYLLKYLNTVVHLFLGISNVENCGIFTGIVAGNLITHFQKHYRYAVHSREFNQAYS